MTQPNSQEDIPQKESNQNDNVNMSFDQLLSLLLDQIKNSESLPMHVRGSFITYLEMENLMTLVYALFKAKRG